MKRRGGGGGSATTQGSRGGGGEATVPKVDRLTGSDLNFRWAHEDFFFSRLWRKKNFLSLVGSIEPVNLSTCQPVICILYSFVQFLQWFIGSYLLSTALHSNVDRLTGSVLSLLGTRNILFLRGSGEKKILVARRLHRTCQPVILSTHVHVHVSLVSLVKDPD